MKRPGLWILIGVLAVGAWYVYEKRPDLIEDLGAPGTADLKASTSPAAAAYEQYASAMAKRNFKMAASFSVETAHEKAVTRVNAVSGRTASSKDRTYLSKAALEEMKRTQVHADEDAEFSYTYEVFEPNEAGTIVTLAATQTLRTPTRTGTARHKATVMQISGAWKVSEFWLADPATP
jgi:hypothetical protein